MMKSLFESKSWSVGVVDVDTVVEMLNFVILAFESRCRRHAIHHVFLFFVHAGLDVFVDVFVDVCVQPWKIV